MRYIDKVKQLSDEEFIDWVINGVVIPTAKVTLKCAHIIISEEREQDWIKRSFIDKRDVITQKLTREI